MKRIVLLLSITAMIFSFQDTNAQRLRDRVKKAIFKEPVEIKSGDDSTTIIEIDDPTQSSSAHFTDAAVMGALGLTGNVDYEDVYHFDAYIQMQITTYKKNGKLDEEMLYNNYLHKEDSDYAMEFNDEDNKSTIIFDTKNSAMLILTESDGEKSGFATTIDPEAMADLAEDYAEDYEDEEEVDMDAYKPMKTGKSKQILGYSCDEYMMEDEESEVHMWVSEKLGKEMRKEWMSNQQTFGAMFTHAYGMNGMVLEYDVMDKDGGKSVMQVQKIDMNHSHKVHTNGYTIMSLRQKTEDE